MAMGTLVLPHSNVYSPEIIPSYDFACPVIVALSFDLRFSLTNSTFSWLWLKHKLLIWHQLEPDNQRNVLAIFQLTLA